MERSVLVSSYRNTRDHLWRWSTCFSWKIPTETRRSIFEKPVHCSSSLHLCREFGKGIKNGKSHSSWLARFDRKMSFHFPGVFPLVFDQSVWHSESTPRDYRDTTVFKMLRFQNVFHMKTRYRRFQVPPVLKAFLKSSVFVTSVDGRPNRSSSVF